MGVNPPFWQFVFACYSYQWLILACYSYHWLVLAWYFYQWLILACYSYQWLILVCYSYQWFVLACYSYQWLKQIYYASPTSGEAYRDRRLTTNFEFWVEIFCVPTCFHVRIPKPCLSVRPSVRLSVCPSVCPSVRLSAPREKISS